MSAKFRKRPVVIEAVKWTGENHEEMQAFLAVDQPLKLHPAGELQKLRILTLEGVIYASPGDWVIKGVKGEFYPCKPDIFEQTYESVHDPRDSALDASREGE
jgi:hypothetical protein